MTKFTQQKISKSFCSIVIDDQLVELTPLKMDYTGEMNGGILSLQIHQIYQNDKGDENSPDRKVVLVLPRTRTQCITGIECILNGETIPLKIEEEKKAEEIAKEGEKQGRTTFRSVSTPDEQFLNIHLGSLSYGSKCEITIRMEIISTNSDSKTYQTVIPFSEQAIDSTQSDTFTFSIVFNEIANISDIDVICAYDRNDFEYTFDGSILTIDKKPLCPIILLTKLETEIPQLIQNDLHDEYSVISVIPHFLNQTVNSDFIFLVDCSGSMSGSRIRNASECLSIFLHSLPVGCKFNVIMFGSNYRSLFRGDGLVDYNSDNLETADKAIENLKANMGGTNLLGPLSEAYKQSEKVSKKGNVVSIFLLTDGEIHDTETVFKLVSKNRSKNRIFSIGIGNEADRDLVSGLAVLSCGKFDFVSESSEITDKVVNLLSLSLAPALTNVSIHASSADGNDQNSLEIVPNPMTPIYDGNLTMLYVKRDSVAEGIEHVLITGNIGDEEVELVVDEVSNICDLSAKKLFAFNAINDYEKMYQDMAEKHKFDNDQNDLKKLKDRIITLSTENGILSKFTSFVGVENSPHREPIEDNDFEVAESNRSFFRRGGGYGHSYRAKMLFDAAPERQSRPSFDESDSESDDDDEGEHEERLCFMSNAAAPHRRYGKKCAKAKRSVKKRCKMAVREAAPQRAQMEAMPIGAAPQRAQMEAMPIGAAPQQQFNIATPEHFNIERQQINAQNDASPAQFGSADYSFAAYPHEFADRIACAAPMSAAPQPPPVQKARFDRSMRGLLTCQEFNGMWKADLFDQLLDFLSDEHAGAGEALSNFFVSMKIGDDEEGRNMRSTIAALCILNRVYAKENSKWKLIQIKAINWLNSKSKEQWAAKIQELVSSI